MPLLSWNTKPIFVLSWSLGVYLVLQFRLFARAHRTRGRWRTARGERWRSQSRVTFATWSHDVPKPSTWLWRGSKVYPGCEGTHIVNKRCYLATGSYTTRYVLILTPTCKSSRGTLLTNGLRTCFLSEMHAWQTWRHAASCLHLRYKGRRPPRVCSWIPFSIAMFGVWGCTGWVGR